MILANLNDINLRRLLPGKIWGEALDWIRDHSATAELGIHKLRGDLMFVNVLSYESLERKYCQFESHRDYVDLQFTIEGVEGIDYCNIRDLKKDGDYDPDKDLQFYMTGPQELTLRIEGDTFCVFFPEDAHRPKIALNDSEKLKKLVIKISLDLLKDENTN